MNYFEESGLSQAEIVELKDEIEGLTRYPHRYFVTMTWVENPSWAYQMNGVQFEEKRDGQVRGYLKTLAQETKSHLKVFSAISRPHINKHFHGIICSEKPIPASSGMRFWRHGQGQGKDFQKYNPRWAEDNGCEDLTRGAVKYIFGKHHQHRKLRWGDVWCPAKKSSCKNGNCTHRKEKYKNRKTDE